MTLTTPIVRSSSLSSHKKEKARIKMIRAFQINSLTMSYFHTGIRTIIGAKAFHCPVRDGKEWDHLAMVIRLDWLPPRHEWRCDQFTEFESA